MFNLLRRHFRPRPTWVLVGILLLQGGTEISVIALIHRLLQSASAGNVQHALFLAGVATGLLLVRQGILVVMHRLEAQMAQVTTTALRTEVFQHIHTLDGQAYVGHRDVADHLPVDLDTIETTVTEVLPRATYNAVTAVVLLSFMAYMDVRLALATLLVLGLGLALAVRLTRRAARSTRARRQHQDKATALVREAIAMRDTTWVHHLVDWQTTRHNDVIDALSVSVKRNHEASTLTVDVGLTAALMAQMTFFTVGALLVYSKGLSTSTLLAAYAAFMIAMNSIGALTRSIPRLVGVQVSTERVFRFLESGPLQQLHPPASCPLRTCFRVDDVWFTYGEEAAVLRGVNLEVKPGSCVAVVGRSGCGKTTLLGVVQGLLSPSAGRCLWDEQPLQQARPRVAVVSQSTPLYDLTISENIRLGRLDATEGEVVLAAQAAGLLEGALPPGGLYAPVGPGGRDLSGGQRQRVAIARALLADPDLLLLDEPTSALDPVTEAAIEKVLFKATNARTTLLVTHQLSQARHADRIAVMKQGEVVQFGTHEALLSAPGEYRRLWQRQSQASFSADGAQGWVDLEMLQTIPLLRELPPARLHALVGAFEPILALPGHDLVRAGEHSTDLYVLARGVADVLSAETNELVGSLETGDFFGEISLLEDIPRTATVRARNFVVALALSRERFFALLGNDPKILATLEQAATKRST